MRTKPYIFVFFFIFSLTFGGLTSRAQSVSPSVSPTPMPSVTPSLTPIPSTPIAPWVKYVPENDIRQEVSITEIRGIRLCKEVVSCPFSIKESPYVEVVIKAAKITGISSDYLTVSVFGQNYKATFSEARILRQNWGDSNIDEFSIGDLADIFGYLDDNDNFLVHGKTIRNVSLNKDSIALEGLLGNIYLPDTFILQTVNQGDQVITVSGDTKIIRNEEVFCIQIIGMMCSVNSSAAIAFSDLKTGDAVVVRGVLDQSNNKVQAELIITGTDGRPFFINLEQEKSKIQNRGGDSLGGINNKIENPSGFREKIQELQNRLSDMMEQLKLRQGTPAP